MTMNETINLLTIEQLAQRLQVSRTTIFSWLKSGNLKEGIHYFRLGRVIRFHWPLAFAIPMCAPRKKIAPDLKEFPQAKKPKANRGTSSGINLDY
jgi:excisionase family DNA binding protein